MIHSLTLLSHIVSLHDAHVEFGISDLGAAICSTSFKLGGNLTLLLAIRCRANSSMNSQQFNCIIDNFFFAFAFWNVYM